MDFVNTQLRPYPRSSMYSKLHIQMLNTDIDNNNNPRRLQLKVTLSYSEVVLINSFMFLVKFGYIQMIHLELNRLVVKKYNLKGSRLVRVYQK